MILPQVTHFAAEHNSKGRNYPVAALRIKDLNNFKPHILG